MEEGRQNEVTQNEELFCKQLFNSVATAAQGRVRSWQVVSGCVVRLVVAFYLQSAQAGDRSRGSRSLTCRAKRRSESDELQIAYTPTALLFLKFNLTCQGK